MPDTFSSLAGNSIILKEANSSVDFMVHGYKEIPFMGGTVYLTTTHVCTIIIAIVLILFAIIVKVRLRSVEVEPKGVEVRPRSGKVEPKGVEVRPRNVGVEPLSEFQNVVEYLVELLSGLVDGSMGKYAAPYVNYVGAIILFIFLSNISGLFGLRPPTADYGTTLALALMTFVIIQYNNIRHNKLGAITGLFKPIPLLFPINLIGEFATPLSMSLRLFGNVLAGTIMMGLWYGLLPFFAKIGLPTFLHFYFDLFSGAIQTYVFAMLTMVFVTDKLGTQ